MLHYALSGDNLAVEHCIGPQPPVPDLSRTRQIAVGTAGRQPQVPDRRGQTMATPHELLNTKIAILNPHKQNLKPQTHDHGYMPLTMA